MAVGAIHVEAAKLNAHRRCEWVRRTVAFAVDPDRPANRRIVALAPRGDDGVDADLRLLRPTGGTSRNLLS